MRHRIKKLHLGKDAAHRKSILRGLATAFFSKERIETTLNRAKILRPFVEKLITRCKTDTLHTRRMVHRDIKDTGVLKKLFLELGPRYVSRPGGYTRILKLGRRKGDGAEVAIIQLLPEGSVVEEVAPAKKK